MFTQIKVCIQKQYWETINNIRHLIISFILNGIILFVFTNRIKNFLLKEIDATTIILIYFLIWIILMSFTIVNDIVSELSSDGIITQIFLSSCKISKYTLIQVIIKSFISIMFITLLLLLCNMFINTFTSSMIISFILTIMTGTFSLLGIGYLLSVLSLVLKNKSFLILLRLFFLYIIVRCDENIFIPFTSCKTILTNLFVNHKLLWENNYMDILILILNSIIYFLSGFFLFKYVVDNKFLFHHNLKDS